MCLIFCAYETHPVYRVVIAANRDEFYDRPTAPAAFWDDAPDLLAGRDLKEGGTWLGITGSGRIAALTNYRTPFYRASFSLKEDVPSRGLIVSNFLRGGGKPVEYIQKLTPGADRYNDFSIILIDQSQICYFSNCGGQLQNLSPGIYGLSNHLLNTPWPKVERGRKALESLLSKNDRPSPEAIFDILADKSRPDDKLLPDTGVGLEWERILSPMFIESPIYGTRSSTVLLIDRENNVTFIERVFNSEPNPWKESRYEFKIDRLQKNEKS